MSKDEEVVDDGLGAAENKFLIDALISDLKRMMKAQMEELHEKFDRLESTHVEQPQNTLNYRRRRSVAPTVAEQWGGKHEDDDREPFRNNRVYEGRFREGINREDSNLSNIKLKIPPFKGKSDPEAYLEWEEKMELLFDGHNFFEQKKVRLATFEFDDYAIMWWKQLCIDRRRSGEGPVESWAEMKRVMRRRFVPSRYHRNLYLQGLHQEDNSIIASNVKPETKATTTTIKGSQSSLSTCSTPNEAKLAERVEKVEVKCLEVEPKGDKDVDDTMACLGDSIQDEVEDATHALVDCMTLIEQKKTGADMMYEPKPLLICMEDNTSYQLECINECGGLQANKEDDISPLPQMGVYEDPFLVYMANGSNIFLGTNHQVKFVFDPGDWPPLHMRIADFPRHRKAILDSQRQRFGTNLF